MIKIWKCKLNKEEEANCELCRREVGKENYSLLFLLEEEGEFGRVHLCMKCFEKRIGKKMKIKKKNEERREIKIFL